MATQSSDGSWLLLPLLLALLSTSGRAQICQPPIGSKSCVCETPSGTIDLTALSNSGGQKAKFSIKYAGHDYLFNPCYGLSFGDESCSSDTAVCQHSGGSQARSCGKLSTEKIVQEGTKVSIQYSDGNGGRSTIVNLICDTSAKTPVLTGVDDQELKYEFNLRSKCACPGANCRVSGSSSSSSGPAPGIFGIVLIVLLLVGVITYFVAGALIMKLKFEKTGLEIIPQKAFWFTLPFLIKDGVMFTFTPLITFLKKKLNKTGEYEKL